MNTQHVPAANTSRLTTLLTFLETDPNNLTLIADAANAALEESMLNQVVELIRRYGFLAAIPPSLSNIEGIAAIRQGRLDDATSIFQLLRDSGHDDPSIRFNLAWVAALEERHEDVLAFLDNEVIALVPRSAALKVQSLHHLDRLEDALAAGQDMLEAYPGDNNLLGALSVAAMDADDFQLAKHYAMQAGGGADALTTQGLISLNDNAPAAAIQLFERALAENPKAARGWLGMGLSLLAQGDAEGAAPCLNKGAEIFGDHLGSWIALGWTHFIRKDMAAAQQSFETALAHDDNFAETHGALAVLDIAQGNIERARKRAAVALRLDKECFGGILARTLLLEIDGKPELATKIRKRAMDMPMGIDGKTLAQAMIGLGMNSSGKKDTP